MLNTLLGSAFVDILKNEWLGIVASAFILVSFLFTKQTITRIINMVGCVVFVIYGFLLPTYSTAFMNGALFIVHVVYLVKDYLARKKNTKEQESLPTETGDKEIAIQDGGNVIEDPVEKDEHNDVK